MSTLDSFFFRYLIKHRKAITVWLLDTIHQALLLNTLYFYLITGYDKPPLQTKVAL